MNELYDSVDYNILSFEYVDSEKNKDVSFYEYMDSKKLFDKIKNSQIDFSEAKNKQNKFLNKLSNIKIGKKKSLLNEIRQIVYSLYQSKEIQKKYTMI